MIIYEGKIRYDELKKSKLDINEVMSLCREQGYFNLNDVYYAIFENSGKLSVMPTPSQKKVTAQDLHIKIEPPSLPNVLIVDGAISFSTLRTIGKDKQWLENKLNISNKKQYKNIILAIYDEQNDEIKINLKRENS